MAPPSAHVSALRLAARAEVARVTAARADRLALLLRAGLSSEEDRQVRGHAVALGEVLGKAWLAFIESPLASQIDALGDPGVGGMPWHSLLQCNPYGRLARWQPVPLRAYT